MLNYKLISVTSLAASLALLATSCSSKVSTSTTASSSTTTEQAQPVQAQSAPAIKLAAKGAAASVQAVASKVDGKAGQAQSPGKVKDGDATPTMQVTNPPALGDGKGARLMYEVGQETHAFGRVMEGTVARHAFELVNEGNEDLIIKQVKPTCGCTVAQVEVENDDGEMVDYVFGDSIIPGRRVQVPAKLHTKGKSGHQTVRINIFSNDPRGTIQLGLEADIDPFFSIAPRFLQFGQVAVGDVIEKKAVISTTKGQLVAMNLVEQSMPAGTTYDLTPVNPDADGRASRWDLSLTLGPNLVEGNLARAISLTSDVDIPGSDKKMPDGSAPKYSATVTMSAQVVGPFSYNPPYLSMGLVRPGQLSTRTVSIVSHDTDFLFADHVPVVRVVGLQNPQAEAGAEATYREWEYADYFTASVRPVDGKNAVEVELRLEGMPDSATGSFRGTLLIELDHKIKREIALVITGVCRGGPAKSK